MRSTTPDDRITIYRIAEEAGVSPSTVSRVLNGNVRVTSANREKVEALIRRYEFEPNPVARSLTGHRSHVIGFIMPDITNPYWGSLFLGAERQALDLGYTLFLANTLNDNSRHATNLESRSLHAMKQKQVDGILISGGRVHEHDVIPEHLQELSSFLEEIPIVTVSGRMPGLDTDSVSSDEAKGIESLVNYLVSVKHTEIGFLGGVSGIEPSDMRVNAFRGSLERHGLSYRPEWRIEGAEFNMEDGREAMERLLQLRSRPTAVICFNDLVAIGAIYTAQRHGLDVPGDISVAGVDNIPLSQYIHPAITTIDLKAAEQGSLAVKMLCDILGKTGARSQVIVTPQLVIRDSCAAPRRHETASRSRASSDSRNEP
jgi:LacI family transcriptional regulator